MSSPHHFYRNQVFNEKNLMSYQKQQEIEDEVLDGQK